MANLRGRGSRCGEIFFRICFLRMASLRQMLLQTCSVPHPWQSTKELSAGAPCLISLSFTLGSRFKDLLSLSPTKSLLSKILSTRSLRRLSQRLLLSFEQDLPCTVSLWLRRFSLVGSSSGSWNNSSMNLFPFKSC